MDTLDEESTNARVYMLRVLLEYNSELSDGQIDAIKCGIEGFVESDPFITNGRVMASLISPRGLLDNEHDL